MNKHEIVVIGGGFGGIASALRLRALGHQVTLIERNAHLGGRAQSLQIDGYKHDTGPTVITAPYLFDELFGLFGERRADHIEFKALDTWYRFIFADGDRFDYGGTPEQIEREIMRVSAADLSGYRALVAHSQRLYEKAYEQLGDVPFNRLGTMIRQVPALARLRADQSVWQLVSKHIKSDKLRQAFSIQPLLVGGNPFDTTSIYALIHYLERAHGVHFAMGGTQALVQALHGLLQRSGVEIHTQTTVRKIHVQQRLVTAIETERGDLFKPDSVVFNGDPMYLYDTMIERKAQAPSLRMKHKTAKLSMGLYVLFFGTKKSYPEVAHHTIWMGSRYKDLLDDIFNKKILPEDFSLYIHRPTATDSSFAPPGHDSFYVLAPVPHLGSGIDWKEEGPKLQARIIAALSRTILPGLQDNIAATHAMTPEDFRSDYLSYQGTGFSLAPIFTQSAWFRFHNHVEGIENLYLAGAGTHPGAGLPGVLTSAKVIERLFKDSSIRKAA